MSRSNSVGHLFLFGKTQLAALAATLVDFIFVVSLVELLGWHYLGAVVVGAASGGATNFLVNRQWTFASTASIFSEAWKYIMVWSGSMFLNVGLVWFFTELLLVKYYLSKGITVLLVALFWNYPLHRFWVFVKSADE